MECQQMHSTSNIKRKDQVVLWLKRPSALRHLVTSALLDQR